jgi:integrase
MAVKKLTLKQRSENTLHWYYDFSYRGRRYRATTGETSRVRAQEVEARVREEVRHGKDPDYRPPALDDLKAQYLSWLEVNRSLVHAERTGRALKNVFSRMKGVHFVDQLTPNAVEAFKRQRLGEASPFTVNLELRCVKALLKRSVKQEWLRALPVEIEQVKTPGRGKVIFLSDEEIPPFLAALPLWAAEAARLMLLTGLRRDEARFLQWEDLDLDGGQLFIRRKPDVGFSPKSGRERNVPMPTELVEELRARAQKSGWVLRDNAGRQLSRWCLNKAFHAAAKAAGTGKAVSPHMLRHTFASRAVKSGADLQALKDILGHSDISTTAIYLHSDAKHRREVVEALSLPRDSRAEEKIIALKG